MRFLIHTSGRTNQPSIRAHRAGATYYLSDQGRWCARFQIAAFEPAATLSKCATCDEQDELTPEAHVSRAFVYPRTVRERHSLRVAL